MACLTPHVLVKQSSSTARGMQGPREALSQGTRHDRRCLCLGSATKAGDQTLITPVH